MKFSLIVLSSLLSVGFAATPTGCNANNCARAVTGTRLGAAHVTQARADCVALLGAPANAQTIPYYAGNCPDFNKYSSACSCWGAVPTIPPVCGGANLLTDPNNCGTCGTVCPSGTCVNGACQVTACAQSICGQYTDCSPGGNGDCQCYSTADGSGFCASSQSCADLSDCTSTADCPTGDVCVVGSCCTRNVCLPAQCGNPANRLVRMSRRAPGDNCTTNSC